MSRKCIPCVYALIFGDNKHVYVGQTENIYNRRHNNASHPNYRVDKAFKLYGKPFQVILEVVENKRERLIKESEYIAKMKADLNLKVGCNGHSDYCVNGQGVSWEEYITYELLNDWGCPYLRQCLFLCDIPVKSRGKSTSLKPIEY